jgi:HSP20 family protein
MLVRWTDPFRDLRLFQNQMNRIFSETFEPTGRVQEEGLSSSWLPAADVSETKDHLTFSFEVPGFKNEDLKLNVENGVLTLEGERKFEGESQEKNYHRVERAYGRFCRSFSLPVNLDTGTVSANLADGVLTVSFPKKEETKPKSIPIGPGGPKSLGSGKKAA